MTRLFAAVLLLAVVTLLTGLALRAINSSVDANTHKTRLYAVATDGSGLTALIVEKDQTYWGPAWSPDGQHLAYTVIPADDANTPKWSPDGQHIAFMWDRDGKNDVFVVDASDGAPVNLTHALPLSIGVPTWSADGQRIAFHAYDVGVAATWLPRVDGEPAWAPGRLPIDTRHWHG